MKLLRLARAHRLDLPTPTNLVPQGTIGQL